MPETAPEVGILPIELTEAGQADPVLSGLGDSFPALQWHGDTFDLPAGAVQLGRSVAYQHQAFRVGPRAYGLQFHLEVTGEMVAAWSRVPAYVASLRACFGPDGFTRLAQDFEGSRAAMQASARQVFEAWLTDSMVQARISAS